MSQPTDFLKNLNPAQKKAVEKVYGQVLVLAGPGTGKTHLLCDIVEDRITSKQLLPAVLVFGELFTGNGDPFAQIISQLSLQLDKKQF